jgi:hypothetical protein
MKISAHIKTFPSHPGQKLWLIYLESILECNSKYIDKHPEVITFMIMVNESIDALF